MGGRVASVLQWLQQPLPRYGVAVLLAVHGDSSGDALLRPTVLSFFFIHFLFLFFETTFLTDLYHFCCVGDDFPHDPCLCSNFCSIGALSAWPAVEFCCALSPSVALS